MSDKLLLKWGTMKGWDLKSETALAAAEKYLRAGDQSLGAMQQQDSPEQKAALCDLIDAIDGKIENDWSGEEMTKDEAKSTSWNIANDLSRRSNPPRLAHARRPLYRRAGSRA